MNLPLPADVIRVEMIIFQLLSLMRKLERAKKLCSSLQQLACLLQLPIRQLHKRKKLEICIEIKRKRKEFSADHYFACYSTFSNQFQFSESFVSNLNQSAQV